MPQIQLDNKYRPRSKKQRDKIKKQKSAERQAKQERARLTSSVTNFPSYETPSWRDAHPVEYKSAPLTPPVEERREQELSEEMAERERLAQQEAERKKKCIAPAFNKGPYQYVGTEDDAKWVGK
jgi:hypothetical protein